MAKTKLQMPSMNIDATHVVFISDIHFGKHKNTEEWQENMRAYFSDMFIPYVKSVKESLSDNEHLICICLGDTYDDRNTINIDVNNVAIDVFEELSSIVPVYMLNGNHDLSMKTNNGNTSIRSLGLINNMKIIKEPTMLTFMPSKVNCIAIPYLGDMKLENQYLNENTGTPFALMHTELEKMKMDNGTVITSGVNSDKFKGKIFAGHIHKRQENGNCIYVGSPYHMTKSDVGNKKGIYLLNVKTGQLTFTENNVSPEYKIYRIEDYEKWSFDERKQYMDNNYNYIVLHEDDMDEIIKKFPNIYNLGDGTAAKKVTLTVIKRKYDIEVDINENYKEKSVEELLHESIKQITLDDYETYERLVKLSDQFYKDACASLAAE